MNFFLNYFFNIFIFIFFSKFTFFFPFILLIILLVYIFFLDFNFMEHLKNISFVIFLIIFYFYFFLFLLYSRNLNIDYFIIVEKVYTSGFFNITLVWGIDNISIFFLILSSVLFPLCVLVNWNYNFYNFKLFVLILIFLEIFLINTFTSINILGFYFFFESTLIPMLFIILYWGSRFRKVHAFYMFFFYTVLGSFFLLFGIFILYSIFHTFDIRLITISKLNTEVQIFLWFFFFIGFAVKVPLPPFHLWLPEAHVEAPTAGSIILAGVLLKLGTYGIFRFMLPVYDYANIFFSPFVYFLCSFAAIYISVVAFRQLDLKKIIAYSSVAHMSFVVAGLFSFTIEGIVGSIFLMISHGFISSALFGCIGMLYDRCGTRLIIYYNNVVKFMPILSIFLFMFTLANMGFPLTSGFIGEFLIVLSAAQSNFLLAICLSFSIVYTASYSMFLYNKICFTTSNYFDTNISFFRDLIKSEFWICFLLTFFIIILGIYPNIIIDKIVLFSEYIIVRNSQC